MAPIAEMGLAIKAESRTGDTGMARRQRQRVKPPDMLLTTPEQLALFCAWEGARRYFEDLKCVIVDEVHATWPSKRGDLLSLGLARLQQFAPSLRRVGLSATVDDPDVIRRWLTPTTEDDVDLVRGAAGAPPVVDVLLSEGRVPWAGHTAQHAMPEVYEAIKQARIALIFVNTRFQAEFAFQELWRLNEDNLPIALHHGSLSAEQRRKVEAAMARGALRAVVCTSTLDLGIDWGDVDLVIQLASPEGRLADGAADRPRQPPARRAQPRPLRAGQPLRDAGVPGRPRGDRRERARRRARAGRRARRARPARDGPAPAPSRSISLRSTTRCAPPAPTATSPGRTSSR